MEDSFYTYTAPAYRKFRPENVLNEAAAITWLSNEHRVDEDEANDFLNEIDQNPEGMFGLRRLTPNEKIIYDRLQNDETVADKRLARLTKQSDDLEDMIQKSRKSTHTTALSAVLPAVVETAHKKTHKGEYADVLDAVLWSDPKKVMEREGISGKWNESSSSSSSSGGKRRKHSKISKISKSKKGGKRKRKEKRTAKRSTKKGKTVKRRKY